VWRRRQTAGIVRHETVLCTKRGVLGIGSAWGSASVGRGMGLARGRAVGVAENRWGAGTRTVGGGDGWRRGRERERERERERAREKILIFPPDTSTESFWWDFSLLSRTSYTYTRKMKMFCTNDISRRSRSTVPTHKTCARTGITALHTLYRGGKAPQLLLYNIGVNSWTDLSIPSVTVGKRETAAFHFCGITNGNKTFLFESFRSIKNHFVRADDVTHNYITRQRRRPSVSARFFHRPRALYCILSLGICIIIVRRDNNNNNNNNNNVISYTAADSLRIVFELSCTR